MKKEFTIINEDTNIDNIYELIKNTDNIYYKFIKPMIERNNKVDIFIELPYERKRSDHVQRLVQNYQVLRPLFKYYDHAYVQSWLQYLYSKDFKLADKYPILRKKFPEDYDHGLNFFYKELKSCVQRYGKSPFDKKCPFEPNKVTVHAIDILQRRPATIDCRPKIDKYKGQFQDIENAQEYTIRFLNYVQKIRPVEKYLYTEKSIPKGLEKNILGFTEFILSTEYKPRGIILCLGIFDEYKIRDEIRNPLKDWFRDKLKGYYQQLQTEYKNRQKSRDVGLKEMGRLLIGISNLYIDFYAVLKAFDEKTSDFIIFYVTLTHAKNIIEVLELLKKLID